jgi:aryl-alcohol dehydrogenase-like predicted oxidoreductase
LKTARQACNASGSSIDSYISHIPDPETPYSETVGALEELRDAGKIRFIGVSNVNLEQLKKYNTSGSISLVQNRLSYLNRAIEPAFSAYCEENSISIVAYQVIERGMLTDVGSRGVQLRDGDLRASKPEFQDDRRAAVSEWVAASLAPLAQQFEASIETLAVWWALQQQAVSIAQIGATSAVQARRLAEAAAFAPTDGTGLAASLEKAYTEFERLAATATGHGSAREFLGLTTYSTYSGSASGA